MTVPSASEVHDKSCKRSFTFWRRRVDILPGIALVAILAAAAFLVRSFEVVGLFSPIVLAVVLGMIWRNSVGVPKLLLPGIRFCSRRVLRFAIILLGLKISIHQVLALGAPLLSYLIVVVLVTFIAVKVFGRILRVDPKLTELLAAGTSICGASAVVATNSVTEAPEADVSYALGCVTLFGTVAMIIYPLASVWGWLGQVEYGLWIGASVHEVGQVVAAGFQASNLSGELAVTTKLARVLLLVPIVLGLGILVRARSHAESYGRVNVPVPWFAFGFALMVVAGSVVTIPASAAEMFDKANVALMAAALAAIGLETSVSALSERGWRPVILSGIGTAVIAGLSFVFALLVS